MRILLVNSNTKDDLLAAPPLGLSYVASAAAAAGHRVRVLDLCFARAAVEKELRKAIRASDPQVVGLSVRNLDNCNLLYPVSYLPGVQGVVRSIRNLTAAPLVIGGTAASLCPEALLQFLGGDYVIVGDGEASFVKLLQALEQKAPGAAIPGVGRFSRGRFCFAPPQANGFPPGNPDLGRWIPLKAYQRMGSAYNIQAKRGCRQRCIYCTYNQVLEGQSCRWRDPREVVDEIEEALHKYRPSTFEFVDSVFNDPPEYAIALLEEIVRRPWRTRFTAMGLNPRHLSLPFLQLMWRAGFRTLMVTPESASDVMLQNYRKGFSREQVLAAADNLSRTRLTAWWYFLIGGPGETVATFQESLDFAISVLPGHGRGNKNKAYFFFGVRMYPGTELWRLGLEQGFMPRDANPLENLWYLAESLDLEEALRRLMTAAAGCGTLFTGFDEGALDYSRFFAFWFRLLRFPEPYWQYFRTSGRIGRLFGRRFSLSPQEAARRLQEILAHQMQGLDRNRPA